MSKRTSKILKFWSKPITECSSKEPKVLYVGLSQQLESKVNCVCKTEFFSWISHAIEDCE